MEALSFVALLMLALLWLLMSPVVLVLFVGVPAGGIAVGIAYDRGVRGPMLAVWAVAGCLGMPGAVWLAAAAAFVALGQFNSQ